MCFFLVILHLNFYDYMIKKLKVLDTLVNFASFNDFLKEIFSISEKLESSYICLCNVHMLLEAKKDLEFCNILNNANLTLPDGMPVAKALSWKYNILQDRVSGMDLLPLLIEECSKLKKSIYFYGSTDEALDSIKKRIYSKYPSLEIKIYSPPFRLLSEKEEQERIKEINQFNPDFVFVALGCPKQEKWMEKHKGKINSCMIGLGGAFPVYAGLQTRAPKWMCDNSLEWIYRLKLEPRRLFARYFRTNIKFLYYICIDFLTNKN